MKNARKFWWRRSAVALIVATACIGLLVPSGPSIADGTEFILDAQTTRVWVNEGVVKRYGLATESVSAVALDVRTRAVKVRLVDERGPLVAIEDLMEKESSSDNRNAR